MNLASKSFSSHLIYLNGFRNITIFYLTVILWAMYSGMMMPYKDDDTGFRKILSKLSLSYLWKERTTVPSNVDYHNLRSIQGLRLFSLVILIYSHIMFMYNISYLANARDYEDMYVPSSHQAFAVLTTFIVLIFFLFSSWLLTVQVYNIFEKHGELSIKHIGILILNRYFRFAVTVGVLILIMRTTLLTRIVGPTNFGVMVFNENACRTNWLQALLFLNNFQYIFDICNPVSWHLSADFQLYILNVLCLFVRFKYKIKATLFFTMLMVISVLLHGGMLYMYNIDVIFKPYLSNLEEVHFKKSVVYTVSYLSTVSIWSSSCIGLIMGDLYYRSKHIIYDKTWVKSSLWFTSFFGLTSLAIIMTKPNTTGLLAAFLGSVVKPTFTLGIGLAVWGMSHNFGGIFKKIFENKYVLLLSNFTFCIYLIHTGIINIINYNVVKPLVISDMKIIKDFFLVLAISFPFGILLTLVIEETGLMIQKKYLPQVPKWLKLKDKDLKAYN